MQKLLSAFRQNRDEASARKLVAYLGKHPMAECLASQLDRVAIQTARLIVAPNMFANN